MDISELKSPISREPIGMAVREVARGVSGTLEPHQGYEFLIAKHGSGITAHHREAHSSNFMRLATVSAGPFADLCSEGLLHRDMPPAELIDTLSAHLETQDNGAFDNDAARFRRLSKTLSADDFEVAVLLGWKAAEFTAKAFVACSANFVDIALNVEALHDGHAILIDRAAIWALDQGQPPELAVINLNDWFAASRTIAAERRLEAKAVVVEMMARGTG